MLYRILIKLPLKPISYVLFTLYLLVLLEVYLLGIGVFGVYRMGFLHESSANLVPIKNVLTYLIHYNHYNLDTFLYNTVGNMLLFVPLGIFVPYITKNVKQVKQIFYISILCSFTIEVLQVVFQLGNFDVDDLLLNTLGGFIGFLIWKTINRNS